MYTQWGEIFDFHYITVGFHYITGQAVVTYQNAVFIAKDATIGSMSAKLGNKIMFWQ